MYLAKPSAIIFLLLTLMPLLWAGCDGEGLLVLEQKVTAGDQPPDQDGGGGPGPAPGEARFTGTWAASYGDDKATSASPLGTNQFAVRIILRQDNTLLTGSGTMFRIFREGSVAQDEVALRVSGTASADDATLTLRSTAPGALDNEHVWYLRLAGSRMAGMYAETNISGVLVRSGHALWHRVATAAIDGTWVAGFSDAHATTGLGVEDRTGLLTLARNPDNTLTGLGTFVVQRSGDVPFEQAFNVTRGAISGSQIGYTFGELDLASGEMDWLGFFAGTLIVNAYGQFNTANELIRFGHATWYRSPDAGPTAVNHEWAVAFDDTAAATGLRRSAYLATVSLRAREGGEVTGSGRLLDEGSDMPVAQTFQVENATILGSRLRMDLRGPSSVFSWDLRLAGSVMVGSYQQTDRAGLFLSRGTAEWRYLTQPNLVETWAASYFDTYGATGPEITQFALVTVSAQDSGGDLAGVGALRFAGETRRRLFTLSGSVVGQDIEWVWRGADLFGDTVWHIRSAGDYLFGTYTNLNSAGVVESKGHAVWVRTTRTQTFAQ
jgi:hypothetical protein